MYIKNIEVKNFRNIEYCYLEPDKNINFICGLNAQGKTNLIESIYFSSIYKSFRTNLKTDLIKKNEDSFLIKIGVINNKVENNIKIILKRNKTKIITIDNQKNNNTNKYINSIIYYPDEISYLKLYPSYRRNIIDRSIFFINNDYLNIFKKYLKCLKQRNFYLKNIDGPDIWREQLIDYGSEIIVQRMDYLERINDQLSRLESHLPIAETYSVEYKKIEKDNIKEKLAADFLKIENNEKKYGYTLFGPHLDDIYFKINGFSINKYSSEGQKRSLLLSYKQAQLLDYKESKGYFPILLFDDIGNELDQSRKNSIFNKILENSGQVFITTTSLPEQCDSQIFKVKNGSFV